MCVKTMKKTALYMNFTNKRQVERSPCASFQFQLARDAKNVDGRDVINSCEFFHQIIRSVERSRLRFAWKNDRTLNENWIKVWKISL